MKDLHHVSSAGHRLVCFVCQGDAFQRRTMTLLTSGIATSGFNKGAQIAVCDTCGYVHTFFQGFLPVWEPVD